MKASKRGGEGGSVCNVRTNSTNEAGPKDDGLLDGEFAQHGMNR